MLESVVPADVYEPVDSSDSAFAAVAPRTRLRAFIVPVVSVLEGVLPVEPEAGRG